MSNFELTTGTYDCCTWGDLVWDAWDEVWYCYHCEGEVPAP